MSHLPIAYPVAVGAALAYQRAGDDRVAMAICGDGATSNGRWHEAINTSADPPAAGRVGRQQQPVRVLDAEPAGVPGARRSPSGPPRTGCPGVRVDGADVLEVYAAAHEAVERARDGGGPTLIESRLAAVARPRGPRPRQVRAAGAARGVHAHKDPVKNFEAVPAGRGGRRRDEDVAEIAGADREGVRRGIRVRAGLAVPRARRRHEGPVGRGRLLDERARARRRDGDG